MSSKKETPKPSTVTELKKEVLKGLNPKQKRFAEFYVISGNKTKAALDAGYSPNSSSWQGSQLSKHPKVRAYIEFLIGEQESEITASIDEAKRRMTLGMRGMLTEQVVVMVKTEKVTYNKAGKRVVTKKEVPTLIDKQISIRDQIEASKLYINIMDKTNVDPIQEKAKSTSERIANAMKDRIASSMTPQIDSQFEFEEDIEEKSVSEDEDTSSE